MLRREFLRSGGFAALGLGLGFEGVAAQLLDPAGWGMHPDGVALADAAELAAVAMEAARATGVQYADIRLSTLTFESIGVSGRTTQPIRGADTFGYGMRVLERGMWGFASGSAPTADEIAATVQRAIVQARSHGPRSSSQIDLAPLQDIATGSWSMPIERDPFSVPVEEKLELMLAATGAALAVRGVGSASCSFDFLRDQRVTANSAGAMVEQTRYWIWPYVGSGTVTVHDPSDRTRNVTRWLDQRVTGRGFEALVEMNLPGLMETAAEQALHMLSARSVDVGRYDLVLDPNALADPAADTLGRPLELDRALGWEANAGGTTFAAPPADVLGTLQVGSELLTLRGDRTTTGTAAVSRWDDEAVETSNFPLIEKGVVVGYQTNRELATELKSYYESQGRPVASNGCATAPLGYELPLIAMPNLVMEPGADGTTIDELIKDVKRGLLLEGRSRGSADHQQLNAQYSPSVAREIRDGRLGDYVRDAAFQFRTPEFWRSLDAVGDRSTFEWVGKAVGKGQPRQIALHSIGAVGARFRQVNVINTGRTG